MEGRIAVVEVTAERGGETLRLASPTVPYTGVNPGWVDTYATRGLALCMGGYGVDEHHSNECNEYFFHLYQVCGLRRGGSQTWW